MIKIAKEEGTTWVMFKQMVSVLEFMPHHAIPSSPKWGNRIKLGGTCDLLY